MISKFKENKVWLRYWVFVIFVAFVTLVTVQIIRDGDEISSWIASSARNFLNVISPIIYAVAISYLLYRPVIFVQRNIQKQYSNIVKKKISHNGKNLFRLLSILIVLLIIVISGIIIFNYIVPPIIENIKSLIDGLPEFQEQLKIWLNDLSNNLKEKNIELESTTNLTNEIVNKISVIGQQIITFVVSGITSLGGFIVDFVVTIILVIYFLKDKEKLFYQMRKFRDTVMPGKVGNHLTILINDLDEMVGKFMVAEILDSIIVGIVSFVLMLIINHPFAALIGVVAGITNIIPFVGPIIGAALAFGLGIFSSFGLGVAGAVLLLLYQQIDGNFVQPKIVGDRIGLAPVWILIVVLIGGSYFGAIGMIFSMPFAGLVRIYFNRYAEKKEAI